MSESCSTLENHLYSNGFTEWETVFFLSYESDLYLIGLENDESFLRSASILVLK